MNIKKLHKFSLIFFCVLISFVLSGCTNQSIKFVRESKFQSVLNQLPIEQNKHEIHNSSGVVIYKDTENRSHNEMQMQFGPKDLDFDIRPRF